MNQSEIIENLENRVKKIEEELGKKKCDVYIELNQNFLFTLITSIILYYMIYN